MKIRHLLVMLGLFWNTSWADFSNSSIQLHPLYPDSRPFIVEIKGNWPSDCHPGEQQPVIKSFEEQKVVIEFEIITEHVTCNDVTTPYRVLVDMSPMVRTGTPLGEQLDIQVNFGGATLEQNVFLVCGPGMDCENMPPDGPRPLSGLYNAPDLANQGLLLVRQNSGMGILPMTYDESGSSQWLITGGALLEGSFFGPVSSWINGDCFGCPPTGTTLEFSDIGHLSILVDRPGVLQVKINDGLFKEYQKFVYGYASFRVGPQGGQTLTDLGGRWGIQENHGSIPSLGDLTEFLPGAFDLVLENIITADVSIQQDGQVSYQVFTPTGDVLGQLVCRGQTANDNNVNVCELIDPTDAAEPLFLFYQEGPSSLSIEYGRPVIELVGTAPGGKVIRLD